MHYINANKSGMSGLYLFFQPFIFALIIKIHKMKKLTLVFAMCGAAMLINIDSSAQGFLKKLKNKASEVANKAVDQKIDKAVGIETSSESPGSSGSGNSSSSNSSSGSSSGRSGRPSNKTGEGLKNTTPPDVTQQIAEAETAHAAGNFSDARYSIQQALLGVELQLGKEVLKSLPSTVNDLPKDTLEDRVTSTQWGWANLTIQRIYRKDDKQLTVIVGNNSAYSGFMNILFAGNYTSQMVRRKTLNR